MNEYSPSARISGYDQYYSYDNNKWPTTSILEQFNTQNILNNAESVTNKQRNHKELPCPKNIGNRCGPGKPYICLAGASRNKCSDNSQTFQNDNQCNYYCNSLRTNISHTPINPLSKQPIPPPLNGTIGSKKIQRCPNNFRTVCNSKYPYQCLTGESVNQCAADASTWENSSTCSSYCNIHEKTEPVKNTRTIKISNKCHKKIWVGIYSQSFTNTNGGFELGENTSTVITVPNNWNGKIWARTGCIFTNGQTDSIQCETGDCNGKLKCDSMGTSPVTVAEFNLSSGINKIDNYNVSLVNGFNIPVVIKPTPGTYQNVNNSNLGKYNCGITGCSYLNPKKCPLELQVKGKDGNYCMSVCDAVKNPSQVQYPQYLNKINQSQVCCEENDSQCNASTWPKSSNTKPYARFFKDQCPDALSWIRDSQNGSYQCIGADYELIFCG